MNSISFNLGRTVLAASLATLVACAASLRAQAVETEWPEYSPISGATGANGTATGFFHVEKIGGCDRIVDPSGRAVVITAIDHVRPLGWPDRDLGYDVYQRYVETNYPSKDAWLDETLGRLRDWGFNTLANHCDEPRLRHRGLAHTVTLYLGGKFGARNAKDPDRYITPWSGPCTGIPNVFHPEFESAVRERVRKECSKELGNPWLLGWFLDNELKWWGSNVARKDLTLFDTIRALPPTHSARKALEDFLARRRGGAEAGRNCTNDEREAFLRLFADRYFSVLCGAIREVDPDHMILGCRFAGPFSNVHPALWETCGKYCDIVSFNCYPWADLDRGVVLGAKGGRPVADLFSDIHGWCGRPLMVTEWAFPALDTGRPCLYGAGQRMPTQALRAKATGLFAKTLLALPFIAGNSYFMFLDQPASGISESFREDSNYGLINEFGKPYGEITGEFRSIYGDIARWASSPVPGCGLSATAGVTGHPSERESYLAAAQDVGSAAVCGVVPAVAENADGGWTLSNEFVSVRTAQPATGRIAQTVSLDGEDVGSLGALLAWRGPDGPVWTPVSLETARAVAPAEEEGPASASLVLRGVSGDETPFRFAITVRLTLALGAHSLLAEIVEVGNIGVEPITFQSVFLMPYPAWKDAKPLPMPPNVWGKPSEAWWRLPGGGAWGAVSRDDAASFRFWRRNEDGTFHPDATFSAGVEPVTLAPGGTWRPSVPMGATIGLHPGR